MEAAGAGFAAAIALAQRFAGQEIGSAQALVAAGIGVPEALEQAATTGGGNVEEASQACSATRCRK
ncbi:MAG: hypothetical protein M1319_07250 [Chloroflexi bacterium]|nr:hypothetical protein [Chloroflexota bacterium]